MGISLSYQRELFLIDSRLALNQLSTFLIVMPSVLARCSFSTLLGYLLTENAERSISTCSMLGDQLHRIPKRSSKSLDPSRS